MPDTQYQKIMSQHPAENPCKRPIHSSCRNIAPDQTITTVLKRRSAFVKSVFDTKRSPKSFSKKKDNKAYNVTALPFARFGNVSTFR